MRMRRSIYLVVLRKGVASPLCRESDEEKPADKTDDKRQNPRSQNQKESGKSDKPAPVAIDFDGIEQRIVALPEPAANYINLRAGQAGQVFYLERARRGRRPLKVH